MREEIIGDCRLILGDCRDVMPALLPVDALITDPPYGIELGIDNSPNGLNKQPYANYSDTFASFQEVVIPAIVMALSLAKRGAIFCNNNLHDLPKPDAIGGIYLPAATGRHCWGFNSLSPICLYGKTPLKGSYSTVLESTEIASPNGHPCPKPIGWMTWLVSRISLPGETVLDCFMGSSSTGVACARLGRKFIGIEIDPGYFDIACRRIEKAYAQPDLFIAQPIKAIQEVML